MIIDINIPEFSFIHFGGESEKDFPESKTCKGNLFLFDPLGFVDATFTIINNTLRIESNIPEWVSKSFVKQWIITSILTHVKNAMNSPSLTDYMEQWEGEKGSPTSLLIEVNNHRSTIQIRI